MRFLALIARLALLHVRAGRHLVKDDMHLRPADL